MPRKHRWSPLHRHVVFAAVLAVLAAFVTAAGAGMGSATVAWLGAVLALSGLATVIASGLGRSANRLVDGAAHVVSSSPRPTSGVRGRCDLHLVVRTRGMAPAAIRYVDPAVPVDRWPVAGTTLPVLVNPTDPRDVQVIWSHAAVFAESSRTVAQAAAFRRGLGSRLEQRGISDRLRFVDERPGGTDQSRAGDDGVRATSSPAGVGAEPADMSAGVPDAAPDPVAEQFAADPGTGPHLAAAVGDTGTAGDAATVGDTATVEDAATVGGAGESGNAGGAGNATAEGQPLPNGRAHEPDRWFEPSEDPTPYLATGFRGPVGPPRNPVPADPPESASPADAEAPASADSPGPTAAHSPWPAQGANGAVVEYPARPVPAQVGSQDGRADARTGRARTEPGEAPDLDGDPIDDLFAAGSSSALGPLGDLDSLLFAYGSPIRDVGVTLVVSDLERSLKFYRDVLGFFEVDSSPGAAMLLVGNGRLVLRQHVGVRIQPPRLIHLTLDVTDIDTAWGAMRDRGVECRDEPRRVFIGEALELWASSFHDPDGHGLALTCWRVRD